MHQPQYREPVSGEYLAPWSYLHGLKDYTDMAAHLENQEGAIAVVNFSPVLLEQIEDYCAQLQDFFAGRGKLRDPLLAALARPELTGSGESRHSLIRSCLQLLSTRMRERCARLRELAELAEWILAHPDTSGYLDAAFVCDFLVWCHLAWLGETVRRTDSRVQRLLQKTQNYTGDDRRELLLVMHELLRGIVPRYRALAAGKRAELSMSPYAHPLLPLLLDFNAAREAHADLPLPGAARYPDGAGRARWHLEHGRRAHARNFLNAPAGCWPSEGALSDATLALLDASGFTWAASGQQVLMHSLGTAQVSSDVLHRPYRVEGQRIAVFFRDDRLSDLIGFEYKSWKADDAVADLSTRLAAIAAESRAGPGRVVSIVLDGENAWEHYADNGYPFLSALYRALVQDQRFCLSTFSQCVADAGVPVRPLTKLVAGSWVKGNLDTWIGHPDKNRAWDFLVEARRHCDAALAAGRLNARQRERLELQLAVCEGSDWFWWPGGENSVASVSRMEHLYRMQLTGLYRLIDELPPDYLSQPFSRGSVQGSGGVMRPAQ
ncbi:MAG: glycoside hydrolase [Gammaproteobacteria bacterium]